MWIGHKEETFYDEGGKALKQVLQNCGCSMIGNVRAQVGQGFEQPGQHTEVCPCPMGQKGWTF